ncbi:hypothetical protein Acr_27g0010200 [Actinidia rufa]|uniref:UDP-glucosyl transferase 88A1 n=1 Tax=Actinidia rufa TaxID=165716 RepID=A0A7J0H8I9_9ERIC|nr:hypothetical protein Acr_27g0010200 [Actinidia rufa]
MQSPLRMTVGDNLRRKPPHIAIVPSSGMGHLTPFLRLAAMLASRGCTITLITANPTVSAAESTHISAFFSAHPRINRLEFEIIPYSPPIPPPTTLSSSNSKQLIAPFESETIHALNNGRVLSCLPPVHPIGPLDPYELEKGPRLPWLDDQSVGSVVYISFGSKTAMSKDQIRELANGLEISRCAFLWVLKTRKVDTDDNEELQEVLEESFLERTKNRGIVVKEWVKQEEILAHPAIGGFVSHCGWNSVTEAARHGVPVLAWPQVGDQRANAEVVERAGLGVWVREWGWGVERLVRGEEIGEKVRVMMSDRELRSRAREVGEEARTAWGVNGSSEKALMGVIDGLKT